MSPRDLRMLPSGAPGHWVRACVADAHPGRAFTLPLDGPVLCTAEELESTGWVRDGNDWVRP